MVGVSSRSSDSLVCRSELIEWRSLSACTTERDTSHLQNAVALETNAGVKTSSSGLLFATRADHRARICSLARMFGPVIDLIKSDILNNGGPPRP